MTRSLRKGLFEIGPLGHGAATAKSFDEKTIQTDLRKVLHRIIQMGKTTAWGYSDNGLGRRGHLEELPQSVSYTKNILWERILEC